MSELLAQPVGALCRPVEPLLAFDTLQRAAELLQATGFELLPIANDHGVIGVLRAEALRDALSAGLEASASVGNIVSAMPPVIAPTSTGAQALRIMQENNLTALLVTDQGGRLFGLLRIVDLIAPRQAPRPARVGGMATPLGVYLTNGALSGGVTGWGLVLTGMTLFTMHIVTGMLSHLILGGDWLTHLPWVGRYHDAIEAVGWAALFMVSFRLLPLSGIHAAEHMTVHAIERGEPLVADVVRRMPRVHPRCGTNIVAGMLIYLTIAGGTWAGEKELQLLAGAVATLAFWRPLGEFLQKYVTTRPPSDKQLEMGIRAGRELLRKYQTEPTSFVSVPRRILASGMLHVIAGSFSMVALLELLTWIFPGLSFLKVYS